MYPYVFSKIIHYTDHHVGAPSTPDDSPLGYLRDMTFVVDIKQGTALIPGTGNEPMSFTEIHDVGRGVAHACLYEGPWVRETGYMVGDCISYNEVVRLVEEITGTVLFYYYHARR
jgi:nucleoside-diphosphate-sugar epimerase